MLSLDLCRRRCTCFNFGRHRRHRRRNASIRALCGEPFTGVGAYGETGTRHTQVDRGGAFANRQFALGFAFLLRDGDGNEVLVVLDEVDEEH